METALDSSLIGLHLPRTATFTVYIHSLLTYLLIEVVAFFSSVTLYCC